MTDNSQDKVLPIASLAADPKNPRRLKAMAKKLRADARNWKGRAAA